MQILSFCHYLVKFGAALNLAPPQATGIAVVVYAHRHARDQWLKIMGSVCGFSPKRPPGLRRRHPTNVAVILTYEALSLCEVPTSNNLPSMLKCSSLTQLRSFASNPSLEDATHPIPAKAVAHD